MKKFIIDCGLVTSEIQLWELYAATINPEGMEHFGYNLAAFNDAITGGGPGWPGACEIHFTNMARVYQFRAGKFYRRLQSIADASGKVRIILEAPIAPKRSWWKL